MERTQKNIICCDDPNFEEDDRSYPPDDDFYIGYTCTKCGKQTIDYYKFICMEEVIEEEK